MEASIITTYRCTNRCQMCNIWKYPSKEKEEFRPALLEKLPDLSFCNITGGEPFLREDIEEIIGIIMKKARRLVISTNGYFTERILEVARRWKNIGFRVSIEGLPAVNDELRGMKDSFDHGLRTLLELKRIGAKDIGFGITVSDRNAKDMLDLYLLSNVMRVEFATAVVHNSYYFHKHDNRVENAEMIAREFEKLSLYLLKTNRPKNWFRAYFNMGLANRVRGGKRPVTCGAGTDIFFLDPFGNILPCNGTDQPAIMGNLKENTFGEIWRSPQANETRRQVKECTKQCWMIGSASPAMKKRIWTPGRWVLKNKLKVIMGKGKEVRLRPVEPMI